MQTDMLVSGFPGRVYLSAASPMLVVLCTCENIWRTTLSVVPQLVYELRFLHRATLACLYQTPRQFSPATTHVC